MIGFGSETPEEEKEMPLAAAEAAEAAAEAAVEDIVPELETPESADMRWNGERQSGVVRPCSRGNCLFTIKSGRGGLPRSCGGSERLTT